MPRLAAVLLAAGSSNRLGQPKQLVRLRGETLVRRSASLMLNLQAETNVAVTGYRSAEVAEELQDLPIAIKENPEWSLGMGGSIVCGLQAVPENADGVLLMLCDQWRLSLSDLNRLKNDWLIDISQIVVAQWKENNAIFSGSPAIFPRQLIHELKCIKKGKGAKPVIEENREMVRFVEMENAAWDLDNPRDLELLREG